MKSFYHIIDHTADLGIAVKADSVNQLFEHAALAFCDILCDIDTIKPKITRIIEIKKENLEELLQGFLSDLLFYFETELELYSKVTIKELTSKKLTAHLQGEKINLNNHKIKTGIKAVTFHQLKIEIINNKWQTTIIFDV